MTPYLELVADFREKVRIEARALKATAILRECDRLRDESLPSLGVRLEDPEDGSGKPRLKLVDTEELLQELEQKRRAEAEKAAEKERKRAEAAEAAAAKEAQRRLPPGDMFRAEVDKYSSFDENVSYYLFLFEILGFYIA